MRTVDHVNSQLAQPRTCQPAAASSQKPRSCGASHLAANVSSSGSVAGVGAGGADFAYAHSTKAATCAGGSSMVYSCFAGVSSMTLLHVARARTQSALVAPPGWTVIHPHCIWELAASFDRLQFLMFKSSSKAACYHQRATNHVCCNQDQIAPP